MLVFVSAQARVHRGKRRMLPFPRIFPLDSLSLNLKLILSALLLGQARNTPDLLVSAHHAAHAWSGQPLSFCVLGVKLRFSEQVFLPIDQSVELYKVLRIPGWQGPYEC